MPVLSPAVAVNYHVYLLHIYTYIISIPDLYVTMLVRSNRNAFECSGSVPAGGPLANSHVIG